MIARRACELCAARADATRDGTIGDRQGCSCRRFWHELRRDPPWSALALDDFKARLVAAHPPASSCWRALTTWRDGFGARRCFGDHDVMVASLSLHRQGAVS